MQAGVSLSYYMEGRHNKRMETKLKFDEEGNFNIRED